MSAPDLSGYVEVSDRIEAFHEEYPEGSLQSQWQYEEVAGNPVLIVKAYAYRNAEDQRPGVGHASEPIPGKTPYTKDSELMNAETSAWGRALAALGFKVKDGIASANEVRSRGGNTNGKKPPSEGQLNFLDGLAKDAGFTDEPRELLLDWAKAELTGGEGGSMSDAIEGLKDKAKRTETADRLQRAAQTWAEKNGAED